MFASRAWSGPVCLRCQLHLAKSALRRGTTLSQRQLHTSQDEQLFEVAAADGKEDGAASHQSHKPRPKQVFKTRGKRVYMKAEELGTGILGKPAHAIVMKEGSRAARREFPIDESLDTPAEHVDFGAILEKEDSPPRPEEVLQNIEDLKPKHLTISTREFDNVKDILLYGFTATQLASYIRKYELLQSQDISHNLVDLPNGAKEQPQDIYPWIVKRSQWLPEVPGSEESSDPRLRGYLLPSMTPKEKLVVRLMRQCWEVSTQELLAGKGYLDVHVREPEFSLLKLGNQRWLHKIARYLLSPLEIIPSESTIRIVAPKTVAETVLAEINGTLENVQSKTIDTRPISSSPLDPALLAEVARLTNSLIVPLKSRHDLRVTWINLDTRQPDLEDLSDRVFRLLLTSQQQYSTPSKLLICPQNDRSARFVVEYGKKEKLTWSDRLSSWARLSAPIEAWDKPGPRKNAAKPTPTWGETLSEDHFLDEFDKPRDDMPLSTEIAESKEPTFNKVSAPILPFLNIQVDPPRESSPEEAEGVPTLTNTAYLWSPETTTTSAVFGHILHKQSPGLKQTIFKAPIINETRRVLSPVIPPLFHFNPPGWIRPSYLDSTITMHFIPTSLWSNNAATMRAPPLELAVTVREPRVGESYVSQIKHVRAVLGTQVTDVCLPNQAVDFRLTQTVTSELLGHAMKHGAGMTPLQEFLTKSHLEPQNGKLETPPHLSGLGLPRRFLSGSQHKDGETAVDTSGDELVDVDYIFAGLEVRHNAETNWDGWKLLYTSIEAGQGGGQRAELSLEAAPGWDYQIRRRPGDISGEAFLDSTYWFAAGVGFSWAELGLGK